MLKTIVLHIGAEKTGTTSIQEFLAQNREALLRQGAYFPRAPGEKNHIRLTLASTNEDRRILRQARLADVREDLDAFRAKLRRDLHEEVEGVQAGTLVLSNEHMHAHLLTDKEILRLKALLPAAGQVRVVFYVRRQDRFALSLYSTGLKAGSRQQRFAFPAAAAPSVAYRYDYLAAYRLWASVFGAEAMCLRIFDRGEMVEGDLLRDFCDAAGVPWSDDYDIPEIKNPSLDVNGAFIFREFNRIRREGGEHISPRAQRQVKQLLVTHFSSGEKMKPSRAEARAFFEAFRERNEELRRLAWPGRQRPIFDADFSEYPEAGSDGEGDVDHALICRTLLAALLKEADAAGAATRAQRGGKMTQTLRAIKRTMLRRRKHT